MTKSERKARAKARRQAERAASEARVKRYDRALSAYWERATPSDVEAGALWYQDAAEVAAEVARLRGCSLESAAGIVSAYSPRKRWITNIRHALMFARGERVPGMQQHTDAATRCLTDGVDGCKAAKTNAFARAIAGDTDAVVVDVWMTRAAGITDRDAPTVVQYREISKAIRRLARRAGVAPRTMQATVWVVARGSAV